MVAGVMLPLALGGLFSGVSPSFPELEARFVGHATSRIVHRYNAAAVRRIKPGNRVYFESESQAEAAGFAWQTV